MPPPRMVTIARSAWVLVVWGFLGVPMGRELPAGGGFLSAQEKTCPAAVARNPTRTPNSTLPALLDPEKTQSLFADALADLQGEEGLPRQVFLWFLIGKTGAVEDARLSAGSGTPQVDSLAVVLVQDMRFRPASLRGEPTCVWLRLRAPFPTGKTSSNWLSPGQETERR